MGTKVILPKGGMGITEATVAKWHKKVGDRVATGDILADVETAKAIQEIRAPIAGVISEIALLEGQTGEVGAEIAVIDAE